jgi:hypothetical protein
VSLDQVHDEELASSALLPRHATCRCQRVCSHVGQVVSHNKGCLPKDVIRQCLRVIQQRKRTCPCGVVLPHGPCALHAPSPSSVDVTVLPPWSFHVPLTLHAAKALAAEIVDSHAKDVATTMVACMVLITALVKTVHCMVQF